MKLVHVVETGARQDDGVFHTAAFAVSEGSRARRTTTLV